MDDTESNEMNSYKGAAAAAAGFVDGGDVDTSSLSNCVSKKFCYTGRARKPRMSFDSAAIRAFNLVFERDAYPGWDIIDALSKKYDIADCERYTIQTWFANKRNRTRSSSQRQKLGASDLDDILLSDTGRSEQQENCLTPAPSCVEKVNTARMGRQLRRVLHSQVTDSVNETLPHVSGDSSSKWSVNELEWSVTGQHLIYDYPCSASLSASKSCPWWMTSPHTTTADHASRLPSVSQLQYLPKWYCPTSSRLAANSGLPSISGCDSIVCRAGISDGSVLPPMYSTKYPLSDITHASSVGTISASQLPSVLSSYNHIDYARSPMLPNEYSELVVPPPWSMQTKLVQPVMYNSFTAKSSRSPWPLLQMRSTPTGSQVAVPPRFNHAPPFPAVTSRIRTPSDSRSLVELRTTPPDESVDSVQSERPLYLSGHSVDIGYLEDSTSPPSKCWRPGQDSIRY